MGGKITALTAQKRNPERVNVFIDGEFAFGLAAIEAIRLRKGQVLSDEDIARLKERDEIEAAHEHALRYLSYRPRSSAEVRENLSKSKRSFSETTIEAVLESLERAGLLDDEAFARFWVENRERSSPRSRRALRYELSRKGVPDEAIRAALDEVEEEDAAYRAGQAVLSRYAREDEVSFRKRLGSYLTRRGFSYGMVRSALDRLWLEAKTQTDSPTNDDLHMDGEA